MNWPVDRIAHVRGVLLTIIIISIAAGVGFYVTGQLARGGQLAAGGQLAPGEAKGDRERQANSSDSHQHEHESADEHGHSSGEALQLTAQARATIGLETQVVAASLYTQHIEIPAVITEWPGRTHVAVTSPLTGVLQSIEVSRGELIESGAPLFRLRLTHQDLVNTQETFLAKLGALDVEEREIERLSTIANSGAIAGKTLITRKYERDKLLASVRAARQAMLLHGLTNMQISSIERNRELIREVTIYAPEIHEDRSLHHDSLLPSSTGVLRRPAERLASLTQPPLLGGHPSHVDAEFLVTELNVRLGESVEAGEELAQLSDYSQILIEGHAFQQDAVALRDAVDTAANIQAIIDQAGTVPEVVSGLKVVWIGNEIDRDSRALPFYVSIVNEPEHSERRGDKRYLSWRYKPGQRLTLRLPVAVMEHAIVVPKDAVAEDGSERYLFVENGDYFERVPVVLLARDSINVAIKNDGQVWPGQLIATKGAHQLQMAIKNQVGGSIDPHAGHNH
ncbi:MAG: efflux RND transporter periplasmic adaptor subunit [Planctomycetota bacterium]|nr:efflux RND transporter periplasmic adaptor subunit [Planctomycetota bacterium]